MPIMKFSSQIEAVGAYFVFDPRDQYSISLFKGFENWNVVSSRMPYDSGLFPFKNLLIHYGKILGSNVVKFTNQKVCDKVIFFVSKWPDLRTNHFQDEGMMRSWPHHVSIQLDDLRIGLSSRGPKCKIKLNFSSMSSILASLSSSSSTWVHLA
ncbi:hypothetical protein PVK06_039300 [Gossypium arboreum]|uniref:Uncharacterized protein n=1 Tax=Gossypium arboreum TaxID=29729 RepID=A0ABR0N388_GOSAR|nr:hypothetical protein PVK06_039300 [Gossypium arboreum]